MERAEVWKTIEGHPNYMVSNLGRVKSNNTKFLSKKAIIDEEGYHLLANNFDPDGYLILGIDGLTQKVHRLVAKAFIPEVKGKTLVNHKDGDKTNNRVENLEWCTNRENIIHAHKNGLIKTRSGKEHPHSKRIVATNGVETLFFDTGIEASRYFGVGASAIHNCLKGRAKTSCGYIWRYADEL